MPRAKTDSKETKKVTKSAASGKFVSKDEAKANPKETVTQTVKKAPAAKKKATKTAPDGLVVGRFYEITFPHRTVYGELMAVTDDHQTFDIWKDGKPKAETLVTSLADTPFREVDRTLAYELSHSSINPQGISE